MTSANPPERTRFFGAREGVESPPIHAVERDEEMTLCGLPVDVALGVLGSREPFMSPHAVAEMLAAQVAPCDICRRLARASDGASRNDGP
jgi:hypothetical protein